MFMSFQIRGLGMHRQKFFEISLRRRGIVYGMCVRSVRTAHAQIISWQR